MFILSTYADGPYWTSCLLPLLLPTGCSFFRPYSYRSSYLSSNLADAFENPATIKEFLSDPNKTQGVLGMRFSNKSDMSFRAQFIPTRLITLTDVQISDTVQLYFRLGDYIKLLPPKQSFRTVLLDGIIDYTKDEIKLMADVPKDRVALFDELPHQKEMPERLWDCFADDAALQPDVRDNFKGTTVLRLMNVRRGGEIVSPESLHSDKNRAKEYGYLLRLRKSYDFEFAYSRILGAGMGGEHVPYDFVFNSPDEYFDVSK
jgi:hypothetical protein